MVTRRIRSASVLALLTLGSGSMAAERHWAEVDPPPLSSPRALVERWVQLDEAALRAQLLDPSAAKSGVDVSLPMPYGGERRFRLRPSAVMAPALAARYPSIRTFAGHAIDAPGDRLRLEFGPDGVGAMLFSSDGVVVLESAGKDGRYRVLQRETAHGRSQLQCSAAQLPPRRLPFTSTPGHAAPPPKAVGGSLRRYRTAIATTGEYSAFHGGTTPTALAAVVAALNRVNEVYENEVGVTFELVANNDQVIFLNGNTDPYTNDDGTAMLDENQSTLDSVIGNANYDLGHVFSTGGGGIAGTGPCITGFKAQGVTGLAQPVNDPFWIDYVAHEIGHQLGGSHTFNNSADGGCAGNRDPATAFEPGSGSTIIAYAGICEGPGNANLQNNSDPYFHVGTLDQMHRLTQDTQPFGGATCGSVVSAPNGAPQIVSTAPFAAGATDAAIPARTPFFLDAVATDPNGDSLTYAWEQLDAGAASPPESDDGTRAIIRSFLPSTASRRTIPRPQNLLAGTSTFGELLPTSNRTLTFRLSVRDNRNGVVWSGAAGQASDVRLQVVNTGAPFRVTAFSSPATLTAGSTASVTWDVAGTTAAPISCASVVIGWSDDGALNFPTQHEVTTANDGSADVVVPNLPNGTSSRLRVRCSSSPFFAINAATLTINGGNGLGDLVFRNGFEEPG